MIAPPRRDDVVGLFGCLKPREKEIILLFLGDVRRYEHLCSRKRV